MCLRLVYSAVVLILLFSDSTAVNQTNCSDSSSCSTDVEQLSSGVFENYTPPIINAAQEDPGEAHMANNGATATPTVIVCCENETPSVLLSDQTRQVEGMPPWAIIILSVSVILGVVGVAILVVFIFFTFNQKGVSDAKNKSIPTDTVSNASTGNGVIARSRGLSHSCTVIVDMENADKTLTHNKASQQQRATSICLHTSDKRIIDVPLSADGYAIPCELQARDLLPEIPSNPFGNTDSSHHDYEEFPDDLEHDWKTTEASNVAYTKTVTTSSDSRHTIPRQLGGFHGFSLPYAKVNLSMKKNKQQIAEIRGRLSSHQSELSYADLDFRSSTSPDLVPLSPHLDGECSDFDMFKLTTRASTIDYGELDRHRALLQAFIAQDDSDSEIDECLEDESPEDERQRKISVSNL